MNRLGKLTAFLFLAMAANSVLAAGRASHVVVVVWDGMRPDRVTRELTPTLFDLANEGVTFKNHHAAYISTTIVNGTTLATGGYPQANGIIANREFRPAINDSKSVASESIEAVRKGDELTRNHYISLPTVAELLQQSGRRTVVASTKTVGLLFDRAARGTNTTDVTLFAGVTLPESCGSDLSHACGQFPNTQTNRDDWTTSALIGPLWADGVPAYSLLWLSEPDYTQHQTAPGSPASLAAMRRSDANLARVLAALDERKVREKTDVIIVSDHGFSSYYEMPNVLAALQRQGVRAFAEKPDDARPGDVMVAMVGASVLLYVTDGRAADVEEVVRLLQAQSFSGVIFTKEAISGTFALRDARIQSADAPDIVVSFRWSADKNSHGVTGFIASDTKTSGRERGTHGSLSPFEMHNTCIAAGPDFRRGVQSHLPSGNVDIAPTILWIMGVKPKQKLSGRVLTEALAGENPATIKFQPQRLEATHQGEGFTWRQYLNFSEVNGVVYFDEGNGSQSR